MELYTRVANYTVHTLGCTEMHWGYSKRTRISIGSQIRRYYIKLNDWTCQRLSGDKE